MNSRVSGSSALGVALIVVASCTTDHPVPTAVLRVPVFERQGDEGGTSGHRMRHLETDLKGRNEVPPHVTPAKGEAIFHVHEDGSVSYKLFVEDIRNPFMAHIHLAPAGANGPVVVWLFPSTAPKPGPASIGPVDGLLAEGTFTAADFVGPLKGRMLAVLLNAIRADTAYVNVHTSNGTSTAGPGNFPGGEIRGQLGVHHGEDEGEE